VKIAKYQEKQQQKAYRQHMGQAVSPYSEGMSPAVGYEAGALEAPPPPSAAAPAPVPYNHRLAPTPAAPTPAVPMAVPTPAMARATPGSAVSAMSQMQGEVGAELLADKEATIMELNETVEILETKVRKLEQLVRLKDAKIHTLIAKMQSGGL